MGIEKIRKGARELIIDLQKHNHNIHIYTTSFRNKIKIRITLQYYGIRIGRIITQTENQKKLKIQCISSSKYPPVFNFDLHIDDSKGVGIESERYNFKAIIIDPTDENWIENVKNKMKNIA